LKFLARRTPLSDAIIGHRVPTKGLQWCNN
jgi:hypothetical protein